VPPTAEDLRERGLRLANQRRYPAARRALEHALSLSEGPDLSARIAGTLAYVRAQLGEPTAAERLVRTALAAEGVGAHTAGVVAGQLASLLAAQGRRAEALEWFGRAIDAIADDASAVANLRMNRSVLNMQIPDVPACVADLEQAIAVYEASGDADAVAEARHNLGYVSLLAGDLLRASREMAQARPAVAAASPANAAICDVDMAQVLREAGLTTEADRILERAALVFGAHRMPVARADAELHLARSLLRTDPLRAARVARAATRRFAAHGSPVDAARAEAVALRAGFSGGGIDRSGRVVPEPRRRPATADVERVAAVLTGAGLRGEAAALRLGREWWAARHGQSGGRTPRLPAAASIEVRLLAHEVHAWRAEAAGRLAAARRSAARGLDELSSWRAAFGSLDLQSSLAMHGTGLLYAGIGAAVRAGDPEIAFEWSERARHLSQLVVPVRPASDAQLAADLAQLRVLRAELPGSDWLSDPRVAELSDSVRRRQWATTGAAGVEERLALDRVRESLGTDTALLSYLFGPGGLVCVVADRASARVVPLPGWEHAREMLTGLRADLDMSAAVRTGPLAEVVRRSLGDRLANLSAALLDAPLAHTTATRLVATVPGILSGLPWTMLPGMAGRRFTLAGSASRWTLDRGRTRSPVTAGFLSGPRVARGGEEVRAGASAWPDALVRDGDAATVDAALAVAARVDVLHIAAHGRHALDSPLFSGLELADGTLFGYDIDRMPQLPATVVLSACEVGRSAVRWGEEAAGMTRAWLHGGSRCVIAASVVVADDDACELLGALHSGLAAGLAPADALAEAASVTGVIAPFQCHGDGL